ncbi:Uncharacterized protein GBIM_02665 [Gryllus bimaculatus]|nr:Uncharacterized protein GBIM_02665 [Gryllus bimaculatus]
MCQADAASMRPLLDDVSVETGFGPEDTAVGHGERSTDHESPLTTVALVEEAPPGPVAAGGLLNTSAETEDQDEVSEELLSGPATELEDGDPSSSMPPDPLINTQRGKEHPPGRSRTESSCSISSKSSCSSKSSTSASKSCATQGSKTGGLSGVQNSVSNVTRSAKGSAQAAVTLPRALNNSTSASASSTSATKKLISCTVRDPGERLRILKERVERAIRERKIFVIHGCFPSIREALKSRGWMEKLECKVVRPLVPNGRTSPDVTPPVFSPHETEASIVSHLMKEAQANFVWNLRSDCADYWVNANKDMIVGLCNYMKQIHWFCEDGVSHTLFPRCYNICQEEELSAFIQDFRMTACIGLIKWVVIRFDKLGEGGVRSPQGKIPISCVQFALRRCSEYVSSRTHEDIDVDDSYNIVWEHQWDQFLTWYYRILQLDGYLNTWIMKPGNRCRGRGIQLVQRLEHVLAKVSPAVMKESRYVVQKYIERPLLIHETKFDIRQWFLNIPPPPPYLGMALAVRGRNINRYGTANPSLRAVTTTSKTRHSSSNTGSGAGGGGGGKDRMHATKKGHKSSKESSKSSSYIGPIIVDLIEDLARHLEKNKSKKMRLFTEKEVHNAANKLVREVESEQQRLEKVGDGQKSTSKPGSKAGSKASSGASTPVKDAHPADAIGAGRRRRRPGPHAARLGRPGPP